MIRLISPLNLLLAAVAAAVTIAGFLLIPAGAILPVHWGLGGDVDGTMPRNWALLQMPIATAIVWLIFLAIGRWGNAERQKASAAVLNAALPAVTGLFVLVQAVIVLTGVGYPVDAVRIIVLGVALLEIILGNVMPKSQPNWFAGIRIPTTLNDSANWQATHRLTGLLMMLGGLVAFIAAIVLGASAPLLIVLVAALILPLVVGTIYSIGLAARSRKAAG